MANEVRSREFTLPPGTFVYVQDGTSGRIKTHVGPTTVTLTNNDAPIVYENNTFKRLDSLDQALQKSVVAPEGYYIALVNPAEGDQHPNESEAKTAPVLKVGHKILLQGPRMFALWPGQSAERIRGHHLRSNQYLLCRVYNEEQARANWSKAVVKRAESSGEGSGNTQPSEAGGTPSPLANVPKDLSVGRRLVIQGTDVSFYIPPTGITVLKDQNGDYTRNAVTLEQLEYSILVDENGKKRIPYGPAVVFPTPTETFVADSEGNIKFKAIELNEIQGLHVKVTKSYKDDVLGELKEGEERFITGKEYPIYYPREEHALVKYDGKHKHFAVAIPAGDGRYVMDRMTGHIRIEHGPTMLLANPVNQVIVRRPLTDKECTLWYPHNAEALEYNRALRDLAKNAPTTRAGAVSEGEAARRRGLASANPEALAAHAVYATNAAMPTKSSLAPSSRVGNQALDALAGDEISRSSTYTAPRTVTLSSKYEGVPKIGVWTGYAVMVVNSKGERKVIQGPSIYLLEYDETLEVLTLSTGKPKTTDAILETPYLLVKNNKVTDVVRVETKDFVTVELKVSYLVNFDDADPKAWFSVKNYVKYLCDHMRSALKGRAKQTSIEDLYSDHLTFVRKVVLGDSPDGHLFKDNGMRVSDVEVLACSIPDVDISKSLADAQREAVKTTIKLNNERRRVEYVQTALGLQLKEQEAKTEMAKVSADLEAEQLAAQLVTIVAKHQQRAQDLAEAQKTAEIETQLERYNTEANLALARARHAQTIAEQKAEQELEVARLQAEAAAVVSKLQALRDGMGEALLTLSSSDAMVKIAQALSVHKMVGGENVVDVMSKMFKGTGLEKVFDKLDKAVANGATKALSAPPQS